MVLERLRDRISSLLNVGDIQDRLRAQRGEQLHNLWCVRRRWDGAGRPTRLQRCDQIPQPALLGNRMAVAPLGGLRDPFEPTLGLLEVGVHQLGLDRLGVPQRIHPAVRVNHVGVVVDANHVHDGVRFPNVRQELVAKSFAPVGARHQPGNVTELDRVRHHLRCLRHRRHGLEPLVGDGHNGDVGFDRGEGVVGDVRGGAGQGREQRGLAGVGKAHDSDLQRQASLPACDEGAGQASAIAVPSSAPASTSLG